MVDPTKITPELIREPQMIAWDRWLRDIHDDISTFSDNASRLERAREIRDELSESYSSLFIDVDIYQLGKRLVDSVIRGWFNQPVGVLCAGITDCDAQCENAQKCAVYEIWARMYPGSNLKDSRIRMCSYLMIFVPEFSERTAKRLGIHQEEAF